MRAVRVLAFVVVLVSAWSPSNVCGQTPGENPRIPNGITGDEPTRVNGSNVRVTAVYNFGKPESQLPTAGKRD